jgi:PH and SEC7 domain-containing protein
LGLHSNLIGDLSPSRFASSQSFTGAEGSVDIELRGKELAARCWAEDEEFLAKEKIAEWLGGL